jgi:imidazolonepropionase-like amidohydrolase
VNRPSTNALLGAALTTGILAAGCAGDWEGAPPDVIIQNVHVVDVAEGRILEDRSVAMREGRIIRVDRADRMADGPSETRIMDGAGGYLIPGLWDMHVHFRGGEELSAENEALLPLYIANGVTTVRDGGGDITERVLAWRDRIDAGELVGPRILTSGPKLDGPTGGWDGSIRLSSPDEAPAALDSLESLGVDYVKLYDGTMSHEVFLALLDETRARNMIVTGHMPMSVRFGEAVDRGLDATEHLYYVFKGGAANEDSVTTAVIERWDSPDPLGFWNALNLLRAGWDDEIARETYARMGEAGTAAVPTLHIGAVLAQVDTADHSEDPELQYIHPDIEATYAGRVEGARRSSPQARADRRALQEHFVRMVGDMHRAGVLFLAGSDAGPFNSFVYPGFALHSELEALTEAGLSPAEALRTATTNAARFMRVERDFGEVGEGFHADLVLLGSNPLDDIRNTRDIQAVIVRGERVFDRDDLESLLSSVRRQAP